MFNRLILYVFAIGLSQSVFSQVISSDTKDNSNAPKIEFNKKVHEFGELKQNSPASCEFKFYNKGKSPLIVSNVSASCGCTVPSWSNKPIVPGDSGVIQVKYSTAATGAIDKLVTVHSNATKLPISLQLKGKVVKN